MMDPLPFSWKGLFTIVGFWGTFFAWWGLMALAGLSLLSLVF